MSTRLWSFESKPGANMLAMGIAKVLMRLVLLRTINAYIFWQHEDVK